MVSRKTLPLLGGSIMVRVITVTLKVLSAAMFLSSISCTNLTEHEMAFKAGLHIISPGDFSTMSIISDMAGARSLLIYSGSFFVASTEGLIYRYDSESMELVEEYQVAAPSPAGFSEIVFSPLENTAYLIGPLGKILEISLPDCTVLDEFSVCQSPVKLALGFESEYLFVVDGPSNSIYRVAINDNKPYNPISFYFTINCIEPANNSDSLLVGVSAAGIRLIEVLSPGTTRKTTLLPDGNYQAFAAVPDDTLFVGVNGYSHASVGILDPFMEYLFVIPPYFYGNIGIQGSTHLIAMGQDWQHAYVLSYLGDNTSRLISYNYCSCAIDQELDIPGFPLDLKVSGNGVIYVLTTE